MEQATKVRLITIINQFREKLCKRSIEPHEFDKLYDFSVEELYEIAVIGQEKCQVMGLV